MPNSCGKMICQQALKISHPVRGQASKEEDVYEQLEMQEEQPRYMTTNCPNRVEDNSQLVGQVSTKVKRWKCVVIALMTVLLVIALVVSLVAVIIYSPLVRSGDNTESSASTAGDNLLSRIQQLEGRMEQQGTNHSFELLQEFLEAQVQRQTDYNYILSRISQLEGRMQAIQGLNVTVANTVISSALYSSQIASMQNLLQTSTLVQTNLRQDLDRLRTINLYEGCIQQTRICTLSTLSTTTHRSCNTGCVHHSWSKSKPLIHNNHMIKCTAHNHNNPIGHTVLHIQYIV